MTGERSAGPCKGLGWELAWRVRGEVGKRGVRVTREVGRCSRAWVMQGLAGSGQDLGFYSVLEKKLLKDAEQNFLESRLTLVMVAVVCRGTSREAEVAPAEPESSGWCGLGCLP